MDDKAGKKKYKVGLALSGGGAKGIAHIGALRALDDLGLKVDVVAGVSAGAIVGSLYADGRSVEEMIDFFKKANLFQMVMPNMPKKGGLVNADRFKRQLSEVLKARTFEELGLPVIINATDLNNGEGVYFSSGKLLECIIASASVPIFFNPVRIDGRMCVDGGLFSNLPASVLRDDCECVIGVHVNPIAPHDYDCSGVFDVAERIFHLAVNGNTIREKKFCDVVIEMADVKKFKMFESSKAEMICQIGYDTTMKVLKDFDFGKFGIELNGKKEGR